MGLWVNFLKTLLENGMRIVLFVGQKTVADWLP